MFTDAFQVGDNSTPIKYRFDGKLFKLRRLQAKSKVQTEVLDEFIFADDMVKGALTEEKMQNKVRIKYLIHIHVTVMISQSVSKRLRMYISQHLESFQGVYHHNEWSMIASAGQVHLPWKHIVKGCAH